MDKGWLKRDRCSLILSRQISSFSSSFPSQATSTAFAECVTTAETQFKHWKMMAPSMVTRDDRLEQKIICQVEVFRNAVTNPGERSSGISDRSKQSKEMEGFQFCAISRGMFEVATPGAIWRCFQEFRHASRTSETDTHSISLVLYSWLWLGIKRKKSKAQRTCCSLDSGQCIDQPLFHVPGATPPWKGKFDSCKL